MEAVPGSNWELLKKRMRMPLIFDGRNIYDRKELEAAGFTYYYIGGNAAC